METRHTSITQVTEMTFSFEERVLMAELETLWLKTMDKEHMNVLGYPLDVMVENVSELAPKKYINKDDYFTYKSEDGGVWLVSKAMELADMDRFFQTYFHMEEEAA